MAPRPQPLALCLLFATVACGAVYMKGSPGGGLTRGFAADWGCDYASTQAAIDTMKSRSKDARIPRAGWTACDVVAAIGVPDAAPVARSGGETTASWHYGDCAGCTVKQVLLVKRGDRWIVDAATTWR